MGVKNGEWSMEQEDIFRLPSLCSSTISMEWR